ncbi:MAG: TetR/AcrR family transcriptional regulator [Chloroflexota bacterium]|jgi:AcrR family transcriptional regulator
MPRPRFNKLSAEKQERILEAAAKEFAAHGFEGASLNQILAEADISKGAAYYYFDDKADLYATTVLHYSQELVADLSYDLAQFTAANFWEKLAAVYRHQFTSYAERPWVFGVAKAGGAMTTEMLTPEPLVELWRQAQFLLAQLIQRGRELGVIRSDMPEDLLLPLLIAVDDTHDRWLLAHWSELAPADLEQAAGRISDTLRRLLSPGQT